LPKSKATPIPITIYLKTDIQQGQEHDSFELTAPGNYYEKNDAFFIRYEEQYETGPVQTVLKISGDHAVILRSGSIKMRMSFYPGQVTNGTYESEIGVLQLVTETISLAHLTRSEDKEGNIQIQYNLKMQGDDVGLYNMSLTYKEEESFK
jgi:uncharacterized beta-barrel protein YwiB (DUF1934 family)